MAKRKTPRTVETLRHDKASRRNIPTAEFRPVLEQAERSPVEAAYARRNRDLDPQLVWRGKDLTDWSDLVVQAPPLFIQEKVHPKALVDDLRRRSREDRAAAEPQPDLFADFNGLPAGDARTEFYRHDANWSNRMILGDSLQVMASLAEREGQRGKVQCIYLDPPYGIRFNSNFQWSTTSRDVKDGKADHITREPEQVKAFRDTWRDGIHSYLTYLRDRLTVARELLAESGSIFVQIGDENVHRVRALMDEIFGTDNFVAQVYFSTTSGRQDDTIDRLGNYVVWFGKNRTKIKYRQLFVNKIESNEESASDLQSQGIRTTGSFEVPAFGRKFKPVPGNHWKATEEGMRRLLIADRVKSLKAVIRYRRFAQDFPVKTLGDVWIDTGGGAGQDKIYVVQTGFRVPHRCILMTTDPGDLVLDPTCGSGTTAYVAEQWGRRWITIDTSRVALALARARVMGARYPYYLLADSPEGQRKEADVSGQAPSEAPTRGDVRQGFVYQRVPHVTLKSIANNAEIDVIQERWQETLEPLRDDLNARLGRSWEEWEVPREAGDPWPAEAAETHRLWQEARSARQQEIDASIAARADTEYLYDKPYEDAGKVRVAGPFTVESLSPHRVAAVDEHDEVLLDRAAENAGAALKAAEQRAPYGPEQDFAGMIVEQLRTAGVQQAHKEDRIAFAAVAPWPGDYVCAEGRYVEGGDGADGNGGGESGPEKRAGIFVGPEFGTVTRPDLAAAAREAGEAGFDVLVACAFNYEAQASEFNRLGRIPVLKARMNADLHMAGELKNTGKGNLFVVFGEPDVEILRVGGDGEAGGDGGDGEAAATGEEAAAADRIQVKINGVDVFHPATGEIRSDGTDGIACWFIDTDYDEESFFVRHAYFLGANDPYKALKTTLRAEIDADAWATLRSDTSRPFAAPRSGRIAVKVINHLGDEVMKVFRV